ncbi:MAG: SpoIIE family protein phosphatase [Ignavibacteria bacterium]
MTSPKAFYRLHRIKFIIAFTVALAVAGFTNLYYVLIVTPISNDECLWIPKKVSKDSLVIYFDKVKINGVAWNAGIRNGDLLISINDVKLRDVNVATVIINKFKEGEYAKYKIIHNKRFVETKVYIKKLINFGNLGFVLLGIIWLFVGFFVIMAKPDGYVQRLFYQIGATIILFLSFIFIPKIPRQEISAYNMAFIYVFDILWTFGSLILPFLMIHFFMIFPRPFKGIEKKWVKRSLYFVPLALFAQSLVFKAFFLYFNFKPDIYFKLISVLNIFFFCGFGAGLFLLLINYFRIKSREERKPLNIIVISYIIGILAITYTFFIASVIADTIYNSPEFFMPIILVALIPVAFGYSIFKYQLMDVSMVIKNTIMYGVATIAIATLYFITVYGLGQGIGSFIGTEYKNAIAALAFVIFAIIFQSTKDKFQDLLTREFYPEQFAYQQVILKFGSDVVSIVGLDNILDSMSGTFINSLKLKHFAILLNSDKSRTFRTARSCGFEASELTITDKSAKLAHYIKEKIVLKSPVTIDRQQFIDIFPHDYGKLIKSGIYTLIPMIINSKVIGLLCFGLKHSGSEFAGKDLELLSAAANQAAVSIENARFYESEAQRFAIERDLEKARHIQESLLPKVIPQLKGLDIAGIMIPAMQVGGDYFDVLQVSPSKVFVVVGDVSGKGLSASLYMSKLQTMMRIYCVADKTPREILIEVNKRIYESIERSWFITLNIALFDTEAGSAKFCRAGHPPLMSVCGNEVRQYQPKGIGLGLETGKIFSNTIEEVEIPIEKEHIYAFYSDGVSEAMNMQSDLYGTEKLAGVIQDYKELAASQIISSVMESVIEFRDKREQNDDITMVFVKTIN